MIRRPRAPLALTLSLLVFAGCADDAVLAPSGALSADRAAAAPGAFRVYSQNAYLGGDTDPIFGLDFTDLPAVIAATTTFWDEVRASRIPERAAAIVDEIEESRPHLVGLQEVTRFRVRDLAAGGAVVDGVDMLAAILDEIGRRGLPYELARAQTTTTVTLPLSPTRLLETGDQLAVLRRTDVEVADGAQGHYGAAFSLGPVTLRRGWVRVTVAHEGVPYHFVNTHLETQRLAPVQAAQATELIGSVTAGLDEVTVIAGDLNSDAANPGAPS